MPRKNTLLNFHNITNGDMSGNLTSTVTNIQFLDNVGVQLVWTGTAVGSFSIEVSADHTQSSTGAVTNAGTWTALTLSPSPTAAGASSNIYIDMNQLSAPWIRVKYTAGSSSGTLNSFITAKEV